VLDPEDQTTREDPIIARAPTPIAPERQKQILGTLLLLGGGAALGAGGMYLWNRWNSPYEDQHEGPYHDPGNYYPPHQGFDPDGQWGDPHGDPNGQPGDPTPPHWGEEPHQDYQPNNNWGPDPDPHPWGVDPSAGGYGHDPSADPHGGYGHDPSTDPHGGYGHDPSAGGGNNTYQGNPYNACDPSGQGFHDIHGYYYPPCRNSQPYYGGYTPQSYWNGHCSFGDSTVGHGEFGNGFQPFGQGYQSAGCGEGQYCAQSNNKAGMFKADINGTFAFPTCPDDEDCDSVVDSQDRCSRTLPRPKTYSEDAWVWKTGPYAGCAGGQIRNTGDSDRDGIADNFDVCPDTPPFTIVAPSSKYMGCSVKQAPPLRTFVVNTITIYKKLVADKQQSTSAGAGTQLTD
jgi:hypothetical protein